MALEFGPLAIGVVSLVISIHSVTVSSKYDIAREARELQQVFESLQDDLRGIEKQSLCNTSQTRNSIQDLVQACERASQWCRAARPSIIDRCSRNQTVAHLLHACREKEGNLKGIKSYGELMESTGKNVCGRGPVFWNVQRWISVGRLLVERLFLMLTGT